MALKAIQSWLRELYDLEVGPCVTEFVCGEQLVRDLGHSPDRGELLLVAEDGDDAAVALFMREKTVDAVQVHGLSVWEATDGFTDACLATEGVSHFLYLMFRAAFDETVSQLELELQAEVDKYASALLSGNGVWAVRAQRELAELRARSRAIRKTLFDDAEFLDDAESEEGERYRLASRLAHAYATELERRFVDRGDIGALLTELRRFYRMGLPGKMRAAQHPPQSD